MGSPKIAIIGAGPAGLTLARLLQYNSIPCTVYELDADRYARTQGGTLDLHEGAAQVALREAGLYEQFLARARPEGEVLKIYEPYGRVLMDENENYGVERPKDMKGRPEIDRVLLREMLLDSLTPESVVWGRKLVRVEPTGDDKYDLHFTDGVESAFDLVVGADGAWSKVRPLVSDAMPYYSGVAGLDVKISDADIREPTLGKRVGGGMCLTLGENKGLLAQRNGDGCVRLYAFLRAPQGWVKDCGIDWTQPEQAKKEMIDRYYGDWDQEAKDLVLKSDPGVIVRSMYMLPIGLKWEPRAGITLVGDAAHLMTPFAGVGVNVAMQDALELARRVIAAKSSWESSALWSDRTSLAAALKEYEAAMFVRAEENAKSTWEYLGLFFHERGAVAMVEHFERIKAKERASAENVSAEDISPGSASAETVSAENTPAEDASAKAVAAEDTSAEITVVESAPAEISPSESVSSEGAPSETASSETGPSETDPSESALSEKVFVEITSTESAPTKAASEETVPVCPHCGRSG